MPQTLALIFDFDDTLVPDSTTSLLIKYGIDPNVFWEKDVKALVTSGFDTSLAYLRLLLENVGEGKPFGLLSSNDLQAFGASLDKAFYPGLRTMLRDLKKEVANEYKGIDIEFYIISGGLQAVIDGSKIVQQNFHGVYACQLAEDATGVLRYIKRCVTFTEKTRYLFEINKGLRPDQTINNPYLVNRDIPAANRRIPFQNMIYVGDGLTDIPCFSLLKKEGGLGFGVFDPGKKSSAKKALLDFLKTGRVISMHAPKYRGADELGSLLRAAVSSRCAAIKVAEAQAEARN